MNKKMKPTILSLFLLLLLVTSCGKDNYDAPESMLTGRITYNGEAVNVRGSDQRVRLQLYQPGYAKKDPIEVFVAQDGTFSAKLFDGQYKMVTRDNNGPWVNARDTTNVTVSGATTMELKVTPYFTISSSTITLPSNMVNTVLASCLIKKIVPTADIDKVILLLNSTSFVDDGYNIQAAEFTGTDIPPLGASSSYTLTLNANALAARSLFARVCVKTKGVDQGIYSPIVKLK